MIPFNYNEYSSPLLVIIAPAMLYAGLLLWRGYRTDTLSDKLVGWLVFLFALQSTSWMLGFAGYYDQSAKTIFMFYFPWKHPYLYGPLVYLFFRALTDRNFRLWKAPNWYHLMPGFLFLLTEVLTAAHDFIVMKVQLMDVIPNDLDQVEGVWLNALPQWMITPLTIFEYASLGGYFIYTLLLYRRYRAYLVREFSNDELVHLRWLRNFLAFWLILLIAVPVIEALAGSIPGMTPYEFSWYGYLLYGLIALYLGFNAYDNGPADYRKVAFIDAAPVTGVTGNIPDRVGADTFSPTAERPGGERPVPDYSDLFRRIEDRMQADDLYLRPTLTLNELAEILRESPHEVSAAINREADANFNFYVNAWRVRDVKEKLTDPAFDHLSLLGIGLEAGFSSKATFNRAFKLHTGLTPRQYQKAQITE